MPSVRAKVENVLFRPYLGPAEIIVVTGPPCSGKSTYVEQQKGPRDLVFDFDRIAEAITGTEKHGDWPLHVRAFVLALRDAFIHKAQYGNTEAERCWIISATGAGLLTLRAKTVTMNTPRDICLKRAAERGSEQVKALEEWYEHNP